MSVKVENIAEPICHGCLSPGRRTSPLRAYSAMYYSLIGHLYPLIPYNEVMLCWECKGMLGKLLIFQTRMITARNLLQQTLYKMDTCALPLSKLTVKTKIDCDCEFQHSEPGAELIEVEVKQEPADVNDQECITANGNDTNNHCDHDQKGNNLLKTEIEVKHKFSAICQTVESQSVSEPQEQKKQNNQIQSPSELKHDTNIAIDCNTKSEETQKVGIQTHPSDQNKCRCKYCSKILCNRSSLARHLRLHSGDLPYNCTLCTKSYCDKSSLDKHIQHHTGDKPYQCTFCQKSFTDNSSLVKHTRTHTGEKPYTCQQCDRSFARSGHLVLHIRTHTGEKPYTCPECNKHFSATSSLVTHMRTHTGERPFTCEQCDKSFSEKGHLVTHMRIHTGERPYACEHCTKRFSDHSCYTNHLRVHSGIKPYECHQCPKTFTQQSTLLSHIRTHTGEKPYACKLCDKKYSQSSSLGQHLKTHVEESNTM